MKTLRCFINSTKLHHMFTHGLSDRSVRSDHQCLSLHRRLSQLSRSVFICHRNACESLLEWFCSAMKSIFISLKASTHRTTGLTPIHENWIECHYIHLKSQCGLWIPQLWLLVPSLLKKMRSQCYNLREKFLEVTKMYPRVRKEAMKR